MKKKILLGVIALILLFICFGVGYNKGKKSVQIQTDTLKIEKVITQYKPAPTYENKLGFKKLTVPSFVILPDQQSNLGHVVDSLRHSADSLKYINDSLEIELHRIQRYYANDDYEAWVSGIDPVLDSIKVKQQIQQIVNTQIIEGDKFRLNVGLNTNGWFDTSYMINPNVNVSYVWKRTTFTGEFGLSVPIRNTSGTVPYFQLGVNYSLWSF